MTLRPRAGVVTVLVVVAVTAVVVGVATSEHRSATRAPTTGRRPGTTSHAPTTTTAAPTTTTAPPTSTTLDPGILPQTGVFPDASGPEFDARMSALWDGVVAGSVQPALPAFFPESAYVAVKAEGDPAADFTGRLLEEYGQDLAAAHALLGPNAAAATLVGVTVDSAYGHWVPPGTCFNRVGYFEVPNARVVYSVGGRVSSFGIASMISWRGEWYVVHLGAVLRSGSGGRWTSPESGPGSPAYSGTC